jgi:hypothetical protein
VRVPGRSGLSSHALGVPIPQNSRSSLISLLCFGVVVALFKNTSTLNFSSIRGPLERARRPPVRVRYPQTTDGRTLPDANELKLLASRQEQAFHEKFGYPSREVPDLWVGKLVALNMLGGRGAVSGMLEAIRDDGFVITVEDRVVFIPRSAVLQMELYETSERS